MGRVFQLAATAACRFVMAQTIRPVVLHRGRGHRPAPFVLACTHVGNLEPVIINCLLNRKIDWMARTEFYRDPRAAALLDMVDAFSVNRQGVPVRAVRTAICRLGMGRVVGIFPEGGVQVGPNAAFRGGTIKAGACVIARRARVPVLPVVVLGTDKLRGIDPWLPMRRGQIWVNFGRLIFPVMNEPRRRKARQIMARNLQREFVRTYQELLDTCGLQDSVAP
jgi:1-acyl-sn-glycerol-3-phosphate acyltransferase